MTTMTAKYINGIDVSKIIFYVQERDKVIKDNGGALYKVITRVILQEGHNVVFYLNSRSFTSYLAELINGDKMSVEIDCEVRYYVNRNTKG